jgi:DNA-binding NarL/FixJ family response regulator
MTRPEDLTPQQLRVADLVADGYTDKVIATRMHIAVRTVRHHIRAIGLAFKIPGDKVTRVEIARRMPKTAA